MNEVVKLERKALLVSTALIAFAMFVLWPFLKNSNFWTNRALFREKKDDAEAGVLLIVMAIIATSFLSNPLGREHVRKYVWGSIPGMATTALLCTLLGLYLIFFGTGDIRMFLGVRCQQC